MEIPARDPEEEAQAEVEPREPSPPQAPRPLLAAVLGLVVPGLGQAYVGRPRKGLLFFLAILAPFALGWALTDFAVVDPGTYPYDFLAQVLLGLPTAAAIALSRGHVLDHLPRWFDVGRLYVQVAGLLNLIAVLDAVGESIGLERQAREWHLARADRLRARERARVEALEAEALRRREAESDGGDVPPEPGANGEGVPDGALEATPSAPTGPAPEGPPSPESPAPASAAPDSPAPECAAPEGPAPDPVAPEAPPPLELPRSEEGLPRRPWEEGS